jgi:hypothetical protein
MALNLSQFSCALIESVLKLLTVLPQRNTSFLQSPPAE